MPLFFNMPISSLKTTNKKTLKNTKNHGVFNKKHVVFQCYFSSPVLEVHTLMTPCFVSTGKTVGKNHKWLADFLSPGQTLAHGLQQGVCFPVVFVGFQFPKKPRSSWWKYKCLPFLPYLWKWKMGVPPIVVSFHLGVAFHFHDYGRKSMQIYLEYWGVARSPFGFIAGK